jgi:hypothetical protein
VDAEEVYFHGRILERVWQHFASVGAWIAHVATFGVYEEAPLAGAAAAEDDGETSFEEVMPRAVGAKDRCAICHECLLEGEQLDGGASKEGVEASPIDPPLKPPVKQVEESRSCEQTNVSVLKAVADEKSCGDLGDPQKMGTEEEEEEEEEGSSPLVFCRRRCGQSVHRACMAEWGRRCVGELKKPAATCVYCSSPWVWLEGEEPSEQEDAPLKAEVFVARGVVHPRQDLNAWPFVPWFVYA